MGAVVAAFPPLEATAPKGDTYRSAGSLVCLVRPALEVRVGEGVGYAVVSCRAQIVCRAGKGQGR